MKTAASLDKLMDIKETLSRLAMPTEFVDDMIDNIGVEFEKQLVIIARRANVGRNTNTSSSSGSTKGRRRLFSLL
jgi:putative lipoic acid-binding regulatory protein